MNKRGSMMKYWKKIFYINEDGSHQPITVQCRCGNFVDIKYYDKRKHVYICDICGETSPRMIKNS